MDRSQNLPNLVARGELVEVTDSEVFQVRLRLGSHLVTPRGLYTHHGIYAGRGKVIHYSGKAEGMQTGPVEQTSIERFSLGRFFWMQAHANPLFVGQSA